MNARINNRNEKECELEVERIIESKGSDFKKAVELTKLSNSELLIINKYTGSLASELNIGLRGATLCPEDDYRIMLLDRALNKLPSFDKEEIYVHFGINSADVENIKWFRNRIGKTIQFPNYLSTSKNRWTDNYFYLIITTRKNSSSRDISSITRDGKQTSEAEVLYKRNSVFRITNFLEKNSCLELVLEELDTNTSDYILNDCYYRNQTH